MNRDGYGARPAVYISFFDGSVVSYDGDKFTLHRQPVDIDADLSALSESEGGQAALVWRARRGDLVKALEDAWWREHEKKREQMTKRIYSAR
ncbi:MAG: hypothetical protein LBR71_06610 [Synergistaceae bacterium]|jgi:hypothetical protein|nr:hypothetical protein [Synergistaceae bacterium]